MDRLHRDMLRRITLAWLLVSLLFLGYALVLGQRRLDLFAAFTVLAAITAHAVTLYPLMFSMNRRIIRFTAEYEKSHIEIVSVLGAAVAQRDFGTSTHNFRVTLYALHLAEAIGKERVDMRALIVGSFLHDVGKIGITDSVLLKEGRLTESEFTIMRSHVEHGVEIISQSRWLLPALSVVRSHHERYDGKGYPSGVSGERIPFEARIFSVVDVFDAITSRRPYKAAESPESALAFLHEQAGTQFDPAVVSAFLPIAIGLHRDIHGLSEPELIHRAAQITDQYHHLILEDDWNSVFSGGSGSIGPFPARRTT
jgi:putative nucleotidyltransferase with HDIG domain